MKQSSIFPNTMTNQIIMLGNLNFVHFTVVKRAKNDERLRYMRLIYQFINICRSDLFKIQIKNFTGLREIVEKLVFSPIKHSFLLSTLTWEKIEFGSAE